MWEKDRKLLNAFKECYANLISSLESGEEADIGGSCVEETEALTSYTIATMNYYKNKHPPELSDKKQRYYNPKMPYFQNF